MFKKAHDDYVMTVQLNLFYRTDFFYGDVVQVRIIYYIIIGVIIIMNKKTYFYIDDVIWVLRDLTAQRPASIFDNPFIAALKKAHDKYGMKVQLNIFCRTDFFYGGSEFTLADMTDAYKKEWSDNCHWLKFGFHAKQEFPDYPYINASYEDVKADFDYTYNNVKRFAGECCFAYGTCTHWLPMSKAGCRALYDGGIKVMSVSYGERSEYNGDPSSLPYGHSFRLLQNRQPETKLFTRVSLNTAITKSICGYNHLPESIGETTIYSVKSYLDEETGMRFKRFCNGPCLNLSELDNLENEFAPLLDKEYIGYATHEQYFYPEYFAYQTDYVEKLLQAAEILSKNGYEYVFAEDLVN